MALLGELLALLYGARGHVRTARGVVYHRQSRSRAHEASRRERERVNRGRGGRVTQMAFAGRRRPGEEEPPDLYEERQRFWWQPPDRLREETDAAPPRGSSTKVLDGELWWVYSPEWGAVSNVELDEEERAHHGTGAGERFKPLLDPSPLIPLLDFAGVEEAGAVLRVRATPRRDLDGPAHWHFHGIGGADEVELEVDRETGIVRRLRALLDGDELFLTELEELALGETFPEGTFVFVPPPGEQVLPPESAQARRRFTLEEAAAEAPFPVFFVPELPEGSWRLRVNFGRPRRRPPAAAHVWLLYSRADGRGSLSLAHRPAGEGGFGWTGYEPPRPEQVERGGVAYTCVRGDRELGRQHSVSFEREGTALQLQSPELDVDTLLDLARTLRRATPAGAGR